MAGIILGCLLLFLLPRDTALRLTQENGWVENLSVLAALSPLAFAGFYLMRAGLRELRRAGGPKADWWRPLFFAGALLVAARVIEKSHLPTCHIFEELLELALVSLIFLVIATQALRRDGAPPIELEQPPA